MGIGKSIFFLSIVMAAVAVYFYRSLDEESQKRYLLIAGVKLTDGLILIDSWLGLINVNGIEPFVEEMASNYVFKRLNSSGLIVSVKQFDGVEVILFDVPHQSKKRPAIVFVHGGGWSHLNPRFYSFLTADLARRLNTLVVSVGYRKAPLYPYPAAFDDVVAATKYFFVNAAMFDVDPGRVAFMGDSAGGNLIVAASYHMAAIRRRNPHGHLPKVLVPLSPTLQVADMMLPSLRDNIHDIVLTKRKVVTYMCHYAFGILSYRDLEECIDTMTTNSHLDDETVSRVRTNMDWTQLLKGKGYEHRPRSPFPQRQTKFQATLSRLALDPGFSPLSALNDTEMRLLPPMYVFGASLDPLRDDAKMLVARLTKVGNLVHYQEMDFYHDPFILSISGLIQTRRSMDHLEAIFIQNAIL